MTSRYERIYVFSITVYEIGNSRFKHPVWSTSPAVAFTFAIFVFGGFVASAGALISIFVRFIATGSTGTGDALRLEAPVVDIEVTLERLLLLIAPCATAVAVGAT